jgi:hypothetical protein
MDGRGCGWPRTACVALVIVAGCGSSAGSGSTDAGDAGAEVAASASVDAPVIPADGVDLCPGAHAPNCGILTVTPVADCTYALPGEPPDPANVGVHVAVDGGFTRIPQDRQDQEGWDYVDMTYASIRLYGSWCDLARAGTLGTPSVVAACIPGCIP